MVEQSVSKGMETVLVVDHVERVRSVAVKVLKDANYNVLQADSGASAIDVAAQYSGSIDLLLSEVQMPGMTGPDLGEVLKKTRPDLRIMHMSGFEGGDLLILNYGWSYIEEPSVPTKLSQMVRDVLAAPNKSQGKLYFEISEDHDPNKKIEAGQTPPADGK